MHTEHLGESRGQTIVADDMMSNIFKNLDLVETGTHVR